MNKQIRATPQAVLVGPERCFLQELLHKNMVLLPFSIHLFGRWGPITQTFLTENGTNSTHIFPTYQPNAASMFHRATTTPCPIGILHTADATWITKLHGKFFRHSYTSPTPSIYTIQQLGLGITKAFLLHIQNATKQYSSMLEAVTPCTINIEH